MNCCRPRRCQLIAARSGVKGRDGRGVRIDAAVLEPRMETALVMQWGGHKRRSPEARYLAQRLDHMQELWFLLLLLLLLLGRRRRDLRLLCRLLYVLYAQAQFACTMLRDKDAVGRVIAQNHR